METKVKATKLFFTQCLFLILKRFKRDLIQTANILISNYTPPYFRLNNEIWGTSGPMGKGSGLFHASGLIMRRDKLDFGRRTEDSFQKNDSAVRVCCCR